jgi:hypothetical protein
MVVLFALAACSSGGGETDGDTDSDTDGPTDGDTDGLPLGAVCTSSPDCASRLCYPDSSGSFCTRPCASDPECSNDLGGSCCQTSPSSQNICYPAHLCGLADGDGDTVVSCEAGTKKCGSNDVLKCNDAGNAWELDHECGELQTCQLGECVGGEDGDSDTTDGDQESDTEEEIDYGCRPPTIQPGSNLATAENALIAESSNPSAAAIIADSTNTAFDDGTYARLDLPGRDAGPLDDQGNVQEMALYLDIDQTYMYTILIDYVCGKDFGEMELYLDDDAEPLERVLGSQPPDYIDLNCDSGIESEKPLKKITYESICIPEGIHTLKARVRGKASGSNGYTLGVDYIMVIPDYGDNTGPVGR